MDRGFDDRAAGPDRLSSALTGATVVHHHPHGLPGLIRAAALSTPDATACADPERTLSYRELDRAGDHFAERILATTGGRQGAVVLRLPRGVVQLVAMLGVLKAGCWYLPMALDEPAARVASMVALAQPVAVSAREPDLGPALESLPRLGVPDTGPAGETVRPLPPVDPATPAYVLFTSGSTGTPKGVMVGHGGLVNRVLWMQRQYELTARDVVLQKTPCTFDVSGWEYFWPLVAGARCVFTAEGEHRDPAAIASLIRRHKVTVCHFVPSVLAAFLDAVDGSLPSLEKVFCSGEALPAAVCELFHRRSDAELHNLYGPTEATIDVTYWPVPRTIRAGDPVCIGAPVDNTVLHVLDERCRPVSPGEPGELWIGGPQVALGYVGRPDLTEEAFRLVGGERCYRTGDLVRVRGDQLEYLGRRDTQIKVRGVRIEAGEVEEALGRHPGVRQAVVVALPAQDGSDEELAALCTPAGAAADPAAVRAFLGDLLPPAFLPSVLRWTGEIPLTASGKADRQRIVAELTAWRRESRNASGDEDDLATCWWRVLDRPAAPVPEEIGFLRLGGHSLAATRIAAWCAGRLHVEVPLSLLLEDNASLTDLERFCAAANRTAPAVLPAVPSGRSPLAPAQRRMWLWSTLHPGSGAYNVVAAVRVRGVLDEDALRSALGQVVARHDALRASVVVRDGEPELRYAEEALCDLPVVTEGTLAELTRRVAEKPIPLSTPPLLRAVLLDTAAETGFVLSLHHLIADQHTADLVLSDLADAYAGRPWPGAAPSFAQYAAAEHAVVGSPRWQADLDHWERRLAGAPGELVLPFLRPPSPTPAFEGEAHHRPFGRPRTERVEAAARALAVTPATLVLTSVAVVLAKWAGTTDLVIGVPASRRRTAGEEELAGFLMDTLPIRLAVSPDADLRTLLTQVRRRQAEALDHARPSFDAIVGRLGLRTRPSANPLFDVWVNDLSRAAPPPVLPGTTVELAGQPDHAALFALNFYLRRPAGEFRLDLVRSAGRVAADVADELADQCLTVLDQLLRYPDRRVRELDLRTAARSAHDTAVPAATDVVDRVLASADRSPDAPAVTHRGATVSYRQLAGQVREFAEQLRKAGAGAGTVVEIRASRGPGLPVALLGTRLAGAVAAVVDHTLPAQRLAEYHRLLRPALVVEAGAEPLLSPGVGEPRALAGAGHVLFTSGSSGRPAGVVVAAAALDQALAWYTREFSPRPGDRTALLGGLGHDPVLRDVLVPLSSGGTLVVPPGEVLGDPSALARFVRDERISLLHATPALLDLLLAGTPGRLDDLRLVVVSGAPLTAGLVRRLRAVTPARVVNAYGATETPQIVAWHEVPPEPGELDDVELAVGRPVPGTDVVVLNGNGAPAGAGELGEVVVRGTQVALGYLGDRAGSGRFGPDPLGADGVRAFHTGDLGRTDPQGRLRLAGRADRQVQVNGLRIELAEIEAAAMAHPAVAEARASLTAGDLGELLTLRVVAKRGGTIEAATLRAHLARLLPAAAVPATVEPVPELFGDANRKAVRKPLERPPSPPAAHRDPLAARIAVVVSSLLGRDLGLRENFFDAGLNSIGLLRLHERLAREFPGRIDVTDLFTHTTLQSLADFLAGRERRPARTATSARTGPRSRQFFAQRRQQVRRNLYRGDEK